MRTPVPMDPLYYSPIVLVLPPLTRPCPDDQLCQLQLNCIVLGLLFAIDTDKHPQWTDRWTQEQAAGMKWYRASLAQQDQSSSSMRHITIDPLIQFRFKLFSSSLNTATKTSIRGRSRRRTASNTRRSRRVAYWLTASLKWAMNGRYVGSDPSPVNEELIVATVVLPSGDHHHHPYYSKVLSPVLNKWRTILHCDNSK